MPRTKEIPGANFSKESFGKYTYWRVWLGKKFTGGKPFQKRFSCYAKAAQWVEEMRQGEEQHGKAIFTLSYDQLTEARSAFERLFEHNVALTAVVDHWIKFQAPLEVQKTFSELEKEFIASRKHIGCRKQTLRQYRSYMKVFCEEFGSSKAITDEGPRSNKGDRR